MNAKERTELVISKVLLLALATVGIAFVVWLGWVRDVPHTANGSLADRTAVQRADTAEQPQQATSMVPAEEVKQYVVIEEWAVRAPLGSQTYDMVASFTPGVEATKDSAWVTFKRIQDAGICGADTGVHLTRSQTKNAAPFTATNPEPVATVGDYSYYLAEADVACLIAPSPEQAQVVEQINGGDIPTLVREILKKLEPSQP